MSEASAVELLVVDDEDAVRRLLERVLRREGFVVAGASNGREALAMLDAGMRPKLIFADLMMPDVNGAELLARVRAVPELSGVPIYIMSGGFEGIAAANGYIEKPIDHAVVIEIARRHCRPDEKA
jgi:CheY-like chemotaxis protein